MSKLPSERIEEIRYALTGGNGGGAEETLFSVIKYLDETAKEKECEHKIKSNGQFEDCVCRKL